MYARILADSINPYHIRLTTVELELPKCLLAELNTHRALSKNVGSSRAVPTNKFLLSVHDSPFIPSKFGKNQSGMQSDEFLEGREAELALKIWLEARDSMVDCVERLTGVKPVNRLGNTKKPGHLTERFLHVHKQHANRLLEPFLNIKAILTGTEEAFMHLFALRLSPHAQPDFVERIEDLAEAYFSHVPLKLKTGQWHLPLIGYEDLEAVKRGELRAEDLIKISVGRVCRVSYLTHDGKRNPQADIDLHDRLITDLHLSPLEHIARCERNKKASGNIRGYTQYRQLIHPGFIKTFDYELYKKAKQIN